jgi:NAD+ diphosphatase
MVIEDLPYTSTPYDRAADRRADPAWVTAQLARPDLRVVPVWRDRCLTRDGAPVTCTGPAVLEAADQTALLGLDEGVPVFAADLSDRTEAEALELCGGEATVDMRHLAASLPPPVAATFAYARGLLYWNRLSRFCGTCGSSTASVHAGHTRQCTGPECGRQLFPRIEPAVIVLVEGPGPEPRCLMARHQGAGPNGFALVAGFVEIGESLEGAVRREVAEEAGVAVGDVTYLGSQGWPFPAGLMVGFRGRALDDTIDVDGAELLEARWFTREQVVERIVNGPGSGPVDSIGGRLLRTWAGLTTNATTSGK